MECNFDRRSFVKAAGATAAVAATVAAPVALARAGEAGAPAADAPKDPDATVYTAAPAPADGKYVARAMGHEDYLYVETTIPGGSMPTTYSGIAMANSELQKNWSLGRYDTSPSYDLETMMTFLKSYFPINDDRFGGELPYRRAMYETSGKLVD